MFVCAHLPLPGCPPTTTYLRSSCSAIGAPDARLACLAEVRGRPSDGRAVRYDLVAAQQPQHCRR